MGVQCVDCVRDAARTTRSPGAVFGSGPAGERPVVTLTLVGVNLVSFVLQYAVPGWTERWLFWPAGGAIEPWRFLSAAFLHSTGSLLHILFNMIALWTVGPYLEATLGRARYVTLYVGAAIGGSVGSVVLAPVVGGWNTASLGASGAVFGLFGAVLVVLRRLGRSAGGMVGVIVLNLAIPFFVPGIAWQAHLGGLVVGAALGAAYAYAPRARRTAVSVAASVLVGAVLVLASVLTYASVGLL